MRSKTVIFFVFCSSLKEMRATTLKSCDWPACSFRTDIGASIHYPTIKSTTPEQRRRRSPLSTTILRMMMAMMMMMMRLCCWWWYIYYDEVSVCLSVTKNHHFLYRSANNHGFGWFPLFFKVVSWFLVGFHGFSRWFHGFSWFLVGFHGFSR